jgi:hypothetical protein
MLANPPPLARISSKFKEPLGRAATPARNCNSPPALFKAIDLSLLFHCRDSREKRLCREKNP